MLEYPFYIRYVNLVTAIQNKNVFHQNHCYHRNIFIVKKLKILNFRATEWSVLAYRREMVCQVEIQTWRHCNSVTPFNAQGLSWFATHLGWITF